MGYDQAEGTGSLARTVGAGCFIGTGLGATTLLILFFGALGGLSFGSCDLTLASVPHAPVRDGLGIAVSTDGTEIVTLDSSNGLLDIIKGGQLRQQVLVGGETTDVALSPDGSTALVTDSEVGNSSGVLAVVNLSTASVTARIGVGSGPTGVVVSPDGRFAYVADTGYLDKGNIDVVDLESNAVVASVPVGEQPTGLAISADGSHLYVVDATIYLPLSSPPASTEPGDVDVIDTKSLTVSATVAVGVAPLFASLSPDGQTLAVGDYGSNAVTLVDTQSLQTRTIPVSDGAFGLTYSPDGRLLFVCGGDSPLVDSAPGAEQLSHVTTDKVSVLDVASGAVMTTLDVKDNPTAATTGPNGTIYVALGNVPAVAAIHPTSFGVSEIGVPGLAPPESGTPGH